MTRCHFCGSAKELRTYQIGGESSPVFHALCPSCMAKTIAHFVLKLVA